MVSKVYHSTTQRTKKPLDGCPDAEKNAAKKVKVWISESSLVVFCGKKHVKKR